MATMEITAKYPGKCQDCGAGFGAGVRIRWEQGGGARHLDCKAAPPQTGSETVCSCGRPKKAQYSRCYRCAFPDSDPDERPYGRAYRESGRCGSCNGPYGFDHC